MIIYVVLFLCSWLICTYESPIDLGNGRIHHFGVKFSHIYCLSANISLELVVPSNRRMLFRFCTNVHIFVIRQIFFPLREIFQPFFFWEMEFFNLIHFETTFCNYFVRSDSSPLGLSNKSKSSKTFNLHKFNQ